jgi:AcrR family transcriptional regulator
MTQADIRRVLEHAEPGARKAHKRQLMACALECFEAAGLEATTIEEIRGRADSSIGSIYHHFGNKEGLVAALFFAGIDDQAALCEAGMAQASGARAVVEGMVRAYLSWVTAQPRFARFLYMARASVAAGPDAEALRQRNRARFRALHDWLARGVAAGEVRELPRETYLPLLIGPSEIYCRAWLSERVKAAPSTHAAVFTQAAWRAVAA